MLDTDLLRHVPDALRQAFVNEGTLQERLAGAICETFVPLCQPDRIPVDLLERLQGLEAELHRHGENLGTVALSETIMAMSPELARDFAEKFLDVALDVECAIRKELKRN